MRIQTLRPSRTVALLGAAAWLFAAPALAQQSSPPMRYLSWVGKPADAGVAPAPPQLRQVANNRYPSIASADYGRPSRYSPSVASGSLTPAGTWYAQPANMAPQPPAPQPQPQPQPIYGSPTAPGSTYRSYAPPAAPQSIAPQAMAPQPYPQPYGGQPISPPQTAMSAAPVYVQPTPPTQPMPGPHFQQQQYLQQQQLQQSGAAPGPAWAQPGYTPQVYAPAAQQPVHDRPHVQGQPQPAPLQQAYTPSTVTGPGWAGPQPVSAGAPVADPMAPRRDAPIFSIQGAAPQGQQPQGPQGQGPQAMQTASAEGPPRSGPRYYSVHRAAGHEPDPTAMPESVYAVIPEGAFLDAARTDLADPPPPPVQTRTINGRVQAISRGDDPSLP